MNPPPLPVLEQEMGQRAPERVIRGGDLLTWRPLRLFLTSRLYPGIFQALSVAIFGFIVYSAFWGTIRPGRNFATVVTWTLWWPLLPLSLFLLGRFWCAVCPFTPPIAAVQRLTKPHRLPGLWLRRYSIWVMVFSFLFLTWADRLWGFTVSPRATGVLLLSLLVLAVGLALFYQRRAFCRHLCPIGALTGVYATTSVMELRAGSSSCRGCPQLCYRGSPEQEGCPLYQFPATMDGNQNCNLCAQCVKLCPKNKLGLRLRFPGRELWHQSHPYLGEAVLAVVLLALVFIQTADMTALWGSYVRWWVAEMGVSNYNVVLTLTFVGGVALAVGAYAFVTAFSRRGDSWARSAAVYGYAYIPLALSVHMSHNGGHLVSEGAQALRTAVAAVAAPLGISYSVNYAATGAPPFSMSLMLVLVIPGALLSFFVLRQIAKRQREQGQPAHWLPHLVFMLALTAVFVGLFLLPMNPRHSH